MMIGNHDTQIAPSLTKRSTDYVSILFGDKSELTARADETRAIIDMIHESTNETNILALNAGIEAAQPEAAQDSTLFGGFLDSVSPPTYY